MFRSLPPAVWPVEALMTLGATGNMTAEPETGEKDPRLPAASREHPKKRIHDDEENAGIAAGYTYLGQFIDHDITFDPASSLQQQNDPMALIDFRTPRLDPTRSTAEGPTISRICTTARSQARAAALRAGSADESPRFAAVQRSERSERCQARADRRQAKRRKRHRVAAACRRAAFSQGDRLEPLFRRQGIDQERRQEEGPAGVQD